MSIHIHKAGINKTLGQQSDAIVTDSLVGDFQPNAGVALTYWDNQVGGQNNLRRFNGVTHNNSTPHNWEFDGTNDYLGNASTDYGGDPFTVDVTTQFTVGAWWYYDDSADNFVFGLGEGSIGLKVESSDGGVELWIEETYSLDTGVTLTNHTWYYLAATYSGSDIWSVYINGKFAGRKEMTQSSATGAVNLFIGAWDGESFLYTVADSRCGHVHVYTAELGGSGLRQNFLATHSINDDRIYGPTYTAISG